MNSEIKIIHDTRPCFTRINGRICKAVFHAFTNDGHGIVELENGDCTTVDAYQIQFVNSLVNEYCYEQRNCI